MYIYVSYPAGAYVKFDYDGNDYLDFLYIILKWYF